MEWGLDGPWVVFGCSYSGLLVTWLKKLYPDEFVGAVVSSAPIEAKVIWMNNRNESYDCKKYLSYIYIKSSEKPMNSINCRWTIINITINCLKFWMLLIRTAPHLWLKV